MEYPYNKFTMLGVYVDDSLTLEHVDYIIKRVNTAIYISSKISVNLLTI
jgi:hypothetical protein